MNAVIETANCVNSSATNEKSLQQTIIDLIVAGHSNPDIAKLTGARPDYVRAVRSRYRLQLRTGVRYRRPTPRPRLRLENIPPRQSNLRELALKLYAMRKEGLL